MSIEKLVKLVSPPKKPAPVGTVKDWARVEKQLGLKLPSDYRTFIERYGSGEFARFFIVYNPFDGSGGLLDKFESHGVNYRASHEDDPENFPLPMFPEVPGMIPWGHDTNGHTYFWLVKDKKKPDEWTVVWDEGDDQGFKEHDWTFSEYLLGVLKGKIGALAGNYPDDDSFVFTPFAVQSESDRSQELADAIDAEDAKKVRELVADGVDVNAPDANGFRPLLVAARNGWPMVRLLLELGADAKIASTQEASVLEGPVFGEDFDSLKALIAAGADAKMSWNGKLCTNVLNSASSEEMIRFLLDAGCPPTGVSGSDRRTPLFWAIENDKLELTRLLIERGANVNAKANVNGKKNVSALGFAKGLKRTAIMKIMKEAGAKE